MQPNDDKNPIKPFLTNNIYKISTNVYTNYLQDISEIRIKTDRNLFLSSYEEERSYKFHALSQFVDIRPDDHIFKKKAITKFTYVNTGSTDIYVRTYKKLFELITELGGFTNGVSNFAVLFLYLFSSNTILWHCISSILTKDEIEMNIAKKIEVRNENDENIIRSSIINVNAKDNRNTKIKKTT